jgi:hypothetical protein
MNELNYASLEASKKLVENGIFLKTDFFYVNTFSDMGWIFRTKGEFNDEDDFIPAPCFTDVWRELPWYVLRDDVNCQLQIEKYNTFTAAYYDGTGPNYTSENPTDALAELLIWAKGQEEV